MNQTDHRRTLRLFLHTDLHRLEAALDGRLWTSRVAERLTHHLRFAAQVRAVYLEGRHPHDELLRTELDHLSPHNVDEAIAAFAESNERLVAAIEQIEETRLHAPVLDPAERGLTVLAHLYDFCRANAMLIEWAQGLPLALDENERWNEWAQEGDG